MLTKDKLLVIRPFKIDNNRMIGLRHSQLDEVENSIPRCLSSYNGL